MEGNLATARKRKGQNEKSHIVTSTHADKLSVREKQTSMSRREPPRQPIASQYGATVSRDRRSGIVFLREEYDRIGCSLTMFTLLVGTRLPEGDLAKHGSPDVDHRQPFVAENRPGYRVIDSLILENARQPK